MEVLMARQDYTEDGNSDILFRNVLTDEVIYWDMFAGKIGSVNNISNVDQSWLVIDTGNYVSGDLDGGYDDILWRSEATGEVVYWDMFKGKPISSVGFGAVDFTWLIVSYEGASDFSGDGEDDLLWRNVNTGEVVVWNMNAGSIASQYSLGAVDFGWTITNTGDFTGNGTDDILWRSSVTGEVGYWNMQGGLNQGFVGLGVIPLQWEVVATGDFSGDGSADLLWQNTLNGDVVLWDLDSGAISSDRDLGRVGFEWGVIQANDYTGDGSDDVLWQRSTGELVVWDFQDGIVTAKFSLPATPSDWDIA
jgi:hypothetical protein